MNSHKKRSAKDYIVMALVLQSGIGAAGTEMINVAFVNRPLIVHTMGTQQAQANADFSFSLSPYINMLKPEISYQITNNFILPFSRIDIINLPSGLTRIYEGANTCPQSGPLNAKQSCVLRFSVDASHYRHSAGLYVHPQPGNSTYIAVSGPQLDNTVARAAGPTQFLVTPLSQDGLSYNATTRSIDGKPTRTGDYHFTIGATNGSLTAIPQELHIQAEVNLRDKPVFKHYYNLASAMPEHDYRLNLMDLVEPTPSFMQTNQVRFRIDTTKDYPSWLSIDNESSTVLHGHVPVSEAGQNRTVTLIATSNTGGDSLTPLTITIPVAFDVEKRPVIEQQEMVLKGEAGTQFYSDLRANITDLSSDSRLKLVLDKVEPAAPWLTVSAQNPTVLEGIVPKDAVGQTYQLTMYANTTVGGNSELVTIPLLIAIDKSKTPHFYLPKPVLPLLYAGQPYLYDFVGFNDVEPQYNDIPYTIELAKEHYNPEWLRIEDNKLIVDKVPNNLNSNQDVYILISNIPGGKSEVIHLSLTIVEAR